MAGGGFVSEGDVKHYQGKITMFVLITCMVAATGGLIFGYDIGISGDDPYVPFVSVIVDAMKILYLIARNFIFAFLNKHWMGYFVDL